jgi:Cu(I)/Ag(I) efflux system membrane fusion protein
MKKSRVITIAVVLIFALVAVLMVRLGRGLRGWKGTASVRQTAVDARSTHQEAGPQGEEEETPSVEIPVEKQQLIGVKTAEVTIRPLHGVIRTVGLIDYDERRLSTVNAKFEGWIEKLYVDYNGKFVRKGEPLADIYSPELVATQQEYLNVLKWARQTEASVGNSTAGGGGGKASVSGLVARDADALVVAAKQRLMLWDITEDIITRIEKSGKPMKALTIYSPVNGYVVQKTALLGMKVMPGEKLFDLADLSTVWITGDVYEYELSLVKPGAQATISLSYFPGKEFLSRVDYIYPFVSGQTRTAKVRFEIPNYGGRLKPQMYTNIEVKIDLGKRLTVPDEAVMDTGPRQIVYVDRGEGNFEPREVLLGLRGEGLREVLKGLRAGERVASASAFLIDSEAQMKNVTPLNAHHD